MLQLHCDVFEKSPHFEPIQNSEGSFTLITSISTKLSYHYVEYLLVISTAFQTSIAQLHFKLRYPRQYLSHKGFMSFNL